MKVSYFEQRKFAAAAISSLAATVLLVVTLAYPDWVEAVSGVDPDHGSGWLEWCLAGTTALVTAFAGGRALRSIQTLPLLRQGGASHRA